MFWIDKAVWNLIIAQHVKKELKLCPIFHPACLSLDFLSLTDFFCSVLFFLFFLLWSPVEYHSIRFDRCHQTPCIYDMLLLIIYSWLCLFLVTTVESEVSPQFSCQIWRWFFFYLFVFLCFFFCIWRWFKWSRIKAVKFEGCWVDSLQHLQCQPTVTFIDVKMSLLAF